MIERLSTVKQRFEEVSDLIIQPDVIVDQKRYIALNREYKDLSALMEKRKQYLNLSQRQKEAEEIIRGTQEKDKKNTKKTRKRTRKEQKRKNKCRKERRESLRERLGRTRGRFWGLDA